MHVIVLVLEIVWSFSITEYIVHSRPVLYISYRDTPTCNEGYVCIVYVCMYIHTYIHTSRYHHGKVKKALAPLWQWPMLLWLVGRPPLCSCKEAPRLLLSEPQVHLFPRNNEITTNQPRSGALVFALEFSVTLTSFP